MTTETAPEAVLTHTPVFFPPTDGSYFGIITKPADGSAKTGVVVLSGTQFGTTTVGKNRMFVSMAARLAVAGYGSIRFDYLGVGEASEGAVDYRLEEPATQAMHAAVDAMRTAGFDNIIVTGTCFGSRTALVGTAEDPDITGLFLIVPPVRDMIKGEGEHPPRSPSRFVVATRRGDEAVDDPAPRPPQGDHGGPHRHPVEVAAAATSSRTAGPCRGRRCRAISRTRRGEHPVPPAVSPAGGAGDSGALHVGH